MFGWIFKYAIIYQVRVSFFDSHIDFIEKSPIIIYNGEKYTFILPIIDKIKCL